MIEEMIIRVKAIADMGGFTRAEASMTRFQSKTSSASSTLSRLGLAGNNAGNLTSQSLNEAASHAQQMGIYTNGTTQKFQALGYEVNNGTSKIQLMSNAIQNFGKYAAMAFTLAIAGLTAFFTIAISKAMEAEKGWSIFAGSIGATTTNIDEVKSAWMGTFETISNETAQTVGNVRDIAGQLSLLGIGTEQLAESTKYVGVIANLRFGGDMTNAMTTYNKAVQGSQMALRTLGLTFADLGYSQKEWTALTEDQRAKILDSYLEEHNWLKANDNYLQTTAGKWQMIQVEATKAVTMFGNMALKLLENSGILDTVLGLLRKFNEDPGFAKRATEIALIGTAILGIVSALWVLTKLKSMFDDVAGAVKVVLQRIGLIQATPCDKKCNVTSSGGGINSTAVQAALTIAGPIALAYAVFKVAQATITTEQVQQAQTTYGTGTANTLSFWQNTDFLGGLGHVVSGLFTGGTPDERAAQTEKMNYLKPQMEKNLDWSTFGGLVPKGMLDNYNPGNWLKGAGGSLMDLLFPKGASAAGGGGAKSSFTKDLGDISNSASQTWSRVTGFFSGGINKAKSIVSGGWNYIKSITSGIWGGITSFISGVINTINSIFNGIWGGINVMISAFQSLYSGVMGVLGPIISAAQAVIDKVNQAKSLFQSDKFGNSGSGIISGTISGAYRGGDVQSMLENASLTPISTIAGSTSKIVIAPVIKIDKISSKEDAEYFSQRTVDEITNYLSDSNDQRGN